MIKRYKIVINVLKDELKICRNKLNYLNSIVLKHEKILKDYKIAVHTVKNRKKSIENILKYLGRDK